jgi:hypothetical protein
LRASIEGRYGRFWYTWYSERHLPERWSFQVRTRLKRRFLGLHGLNFRLAMPFPFL